MNLKMVPSLEQPREKLERFGVKSLTNAELLAIVLQSGSKTETAVGLGHQIINMFEQGLEGLSDATLEELKKLNGIGNAKACQVTAAVELGKRVSQSEKKILGQFNSPKKVADFFEAEMKHLNKEKFIVAFLNTKHMVTSYEVISVGSLNASIVHPREVYNRAIKKSAAFIILVHNHPSGNPAPSEEDKVVTERLKQVGIVVGIKVLDHIIVSDNGYYSFKEMDLI